MPVDHATRGLRGQPDVAGFPPSVNEECGRAGLTFPAASAPFRVAPRVVQAELLDTLPPTDPAARHNRRDLRWINAAMGNHRWMGQVLRRRCTAADRVLEIGAGTGELAAALAGRGLAVEALDRCPCPPGWRSGLRWHCADLRTFDAYHCYPVVCGNLIFHQFTAAELRTLGARLRAAARLVVACEPARRRRSQWLFGLAAPMFGANYVSRHDGRVSIAAGFLGDELPHLLRLARPHWDWRCATTFLGAYRMIAWRATPA